MTLPTLLAFAMFPGWAPGLQTAALFITIDVLVGYFAEPLLIGHRTGVSSLALLVSGIFWAWLWGPIGLVLSTPLTVCVAVLGRHVRQLDFLNVLLGDQSALEPDVRFYQRLLSRDATDATQLALKSLRERGWTGMFDELVLPALCLAAQDRDRNQISGQDFQKVQDSVRAVLRRLERAQRKAPLESTGPPIAVMGIAAHSDADALLLQLLDVALRAVNARLETFPAGAELEKTLAEIAARKPRAVFITSLPPAGGARARYVSRRIKAVLPEGEVLVLRPATGSQDPARSSAALREAGAHSVASTMSAAQGRLMKALGR